MKDYYYFLGIRQNASVEDIKKAYRKLSLKYHPDKNDNDEFFSDRFREILEAYETLMDTNRRKLYDQNLSSQQQNVKSSLPPKIKSFSASKIRVQRDEEITIYWNTYDADLVKIVPFGLEKPNGERTIRIKEFDSVGKFQILLHATNTILHKTVVQGITITQIEDNGNPYSETFFDPAEKHVKIGQKKYRNMVSAIVFLVLIILIIWTIFN